MILGYARVSTAEQNLALQIDALQTAGAQRIFEDKGVSGSAVLKPAFADMLKHAQPGDEVIVWRLDRLGRSLTGLITELELLAALNLGFRSISEQIETVTPAGRLFFHMVGAFAQFERDVIRERTTAGLQAAKSRGTKLGRPPLISDTQWSHAKSLLSGPAAHSVSAVAERLGVSRQAIYKRLRREETDSAEDRVAPSPSQDA